MTKKMFGKVLRLVKSGNTEKRKNERIIIKNFSQLFISKKNKENTQNQTENTSDINVLDISTEGLSCTLKNQDFTISDSIEIKSKKGFIVLEGVILQQELLHANSKSELLRISVRFTKIHDNQFIQDYINYHSQHTQSTRVG